MAARSGQLGNGVAANNPQNIGQPNQTLYCTNLNDKVKKDDLRRALYMLFSTYGPVLDVVALKNKKMRGQAHIVFRDIQASTQALRSLQGFDLLGKEMKIVYAKGQSNIINKLRGTFETSVVVPEPTELQRSIFNAPPPSHLPKPLPVPVANGVKPEEAASPGPQGIKRPREEESEGEGAPMEEDDESDAPMEASSDED